jgi:hypothetical protein
MKHVFLTLNKDNFVKIPDQKKHSENVLVLFYGTSSDCIDECADTYSQEITLQNKRVFPINTTQDYMKLMHLTLNDYLIMKSLYSSSIQTSENASFALQVLRCGDNLIASIHAQHEEGAIKHINQLVNTVTCAQP